MFQGGFPRAKAPRCRKTLLEILLFKVRIRKGTVTSLVHVSNAFEVHRISFTGNCLRSRVVITKREDRLGLIWINKK